MIDYKEIVNSLSDDRVKTILEQLDIPYEDKGGYLVMPTYCHHHKTEDASHKLYYYKNNKIFVCYSNCGNMSIFKFLRQYYENQGIEYSWHDDILCLINGGSITKNFDGLTPPKYESITSIYNATAITQELPEYPQGVLDCFVKTYPIEWLNDGISTTAMDKFNIRYSISQNKIIIPHYDIYGRLVGIRGRALNSDEIEMVGKYMPIQLEDVWYKHPLSMNLYGLYENQQNIKNCGVCFLAESEKSVLQAESFKRPNCFVAVCGSNLNKFALNILMRAAAPREIVICFDNEELPQQTKYFNKLLKICRKYSTYTNLSFIYDREHLTQLKDSPTDHGEEIFEKLLQKRVIVK